jgi:MFS family permease
MVSPVRLTLLHGAHQLLAWGTTFYLPAIIAGVAAADLGTSRAAVVGGFSWALLVTGTCAPRVGRHIDRRGGRGVLTVSGIVLALGLVLLATAQGLAWWYAAWTVLGAGMALGLYDATFATIGCLLGREATPVITGVTLIAGFASTVFWPLGAWLAAWLSWRETLLIYAAINLAVNVPLVLLLPSAPAVSVARAGRVKDAPSAAQAWRGPALACLSGFFTLRWFITSALAVYILPLLRGTGLTEAETVTVAALIGPGQVAGRVLEWSVGQRIPLLTRARLGAALFPLAAVVMVLGTGPLTAGAFALLYGMSNGILTINRGTLPMALFGPGGYATLLGWLAVPVLLAQASAPTLTAPLIGALPAADIFAIAGIAAAAAAALLLPLQIKKKPE